MDFFHLRIFHKLGFSGEIKKLVYLWERTVEVAKRREGLKKQHSVLFFPERDRADARPPVPTKVSLIWDTDGQWPPLHKEIRANKP